MTITREFTKEQLIARIKQVTAINKYRIKRDSDADGLVMDNELFAIALASIEVDNEEWREVEGTDGAYSVSSLGRIRSNRSGKYLSTNSRVGSGYVKADVYVNGARRQTSLHRLVAEAFLEREDGKNEVNHINGVKTDNRSNNLEWVSRSENVNHSYYELGNNIKPLIAEPVSGVGPSLVFRSGMDVEKNGFHSGHVYECLRGVYSQHAGYRWSYFKSATPAPVSVPDEITKEDCPAFVKYDITEVDEAWARGFNACRAAMHGKAEPVSHSTIPEDFDFDRFNDVAWLDAVASNPHMHSPTTSTIAMVAIELNKRLDAGNSPVIPDGWVACSERMPAENDIVLVVDDGYFVCEAQHREGDFYSAVRGNWEFFETTCRDVEFWQPLPAAPQQETE